MLGLFGKKKSAQDWYNEGIENYDQENFEEAVRSYDKALEIDPGYAEAWNNKGNALNNIGNYEEAIECLDKALVLKPDFSFAWNNKGMALDGLGNYEEAIECYDKAIGIDPNLTDAWNNKGFTLGNIGLYDEAIECYDKAIEIDPDYSHAWNNKGTALDNLGKYDEAIGCYDKTLELDPHYALAWYNKGLALNNAGNYEEAIECSDKAIELDPDNVLAWNNKGMALDSLGIYDEAIECYDRAIEIDPDFADVRNNKGFTLSNLGRYAEAIECYDKALELYPEFKEAIENKEMTLKNINEGTEPAPDFNKETDEVEDGLEVLRGYSVLSNNDIKFGIRLNNKTGSTLIDTDVIFDYSRNLFATKDTEIQHLGNISPNSTRTATCILKPLGCIHNEQINALITYKDHTGKKLTLHMIPKEVHSICPFMKEKPLSEGEYTCLVAGSEFIQEGISFKGISAEELAKFIGETCRHMLHKVREYDIEGKKVIYLSGESIGEKAYYLLTAVIQENKGLTHAALRAYSDRKYGLTGFMNEMTGNIRNLVGSVQDAKELGVIENTQVINIIDSVVQRTDFGMGRGTATVSTGENMTQRAGIDEPVKICQGCGREVEAGEKFCIECGAKL